MAVQNHHQSRVGSHLPTRIKASTAPADETTVAAKAMATARTATGFIFLWAFPDKPSGWHYATGSARGWLGAGAPTKGSPSGVSAGPLQSFFHAIAGQGW